jgi:hypothetical protein
LSGDPERGARLLAAVLEDAGVDTLDAYLSSALGFSAPTVSLVNAHRILGGLPPGADVAEAGATLLDLCTIGETFFLRHRQQLAWLE